MPAGFQRSLVQKCPLPFQHILLGLANNFPCSMTPDRFLPTHSCPPDSRGEEKRCLFYPYYYWIPDVRTNKERGDSHVLCTLRQQYVINISLCLGTWEEAQTTCFGIRSSTFFWEIVSLYVAGCGQDVRHTTFFMESFVPSLGLEWNKELQIGTFILFTRIKAVKNLIVGVLAMRSSVLGYKIKLYSCISM